MPPSTTLHGCLLRLPRMMIPACIHLWLSYAVLSETLGHRTVIATLQITYTHNVREVGTVGVVSCCHLFLYCYYGPVVLVFIFCTQTSFMLPYNASTLLQYQ